MPIIQSISDSTQVHIGLELILRYSDKLPSPIIIRVIISGNRSIYEERVITPVNTEEAHIYIESGESSETR